MLDGAGRVYLGDVVLSTGRARAQAEAYGHSFRRECAYLTVHSMLHLTGFDHETPEDKAVMRKREEAIMALLGLRREA
jgi:probable rRNA maturation factor